MHVVGSLEFMPSVTRVRKVLKLLQTAKLLVMDFDGVHTDNFATISQSGRESVRVSRSDGMGISLLHKASLHLLILSTEENEVVSARASKLKVECIQGVTDKATVMKKWLSTRNINLGEIIFIGNDINDVELLSLSGLPVVVRDSHKAALSVAEIRLRRNGGQGAVRELADLILQSRSQLNAIEAFILTLRLSLRQLGI